MLGQKADDPRQHRALRRSSSENAFLRQAREVNDSADSRAMLAPGFPQRQLSPQRMPVRAPTLRRCSSEDSLLHHQDLTTRLVRDEKDSRAMRTPGVDQGLQQQSSSKRAPARPPTALRRSSSEDSLLHHQDLTTPQPIRSFKRAGVQHANESMATYPERRAAYNRQTGVLLSLDAETSERLVTRSRMHLASMPAKTTAAPQPIRSFKRAGVQHANDRLETSLERRAAYNRHTGVLLSLDAELLHAFREAEASGAVVQAPRQPEDWSDRAFPAVPATRRVVQNLSNDRWIRALICISIVLLLLALCSRGVAAATCSGAAPTTRRSTSGPSHKDGVRTQEVFSTQHRLFL